MVRKPPAGIDPEAFMRRYWQREPLLVRAAFPGRPIWEAWEGEPWRLIRVP